MATIFFLQVKAPWPQYWKHCCKAKPDGWEDERIPWWSPICFRYSDVIKPAKRGWPGSVEGGVIGGGHMLICCVVSSPLLLHLSPHLCLHPTLFLSKFRWDLKLLCDCQRWQAPCPTVLLSVRSFIFVCVALWGPRLRTELSCCEAYWEDVEPLQLWLRGSSERTQKKMAKKILVVYKFICFHGFVIIAKQSGKAACADWALNCCMLWASLTTWWQNQPTNRMEDGRWNMHCTVLKYFTWSKYPDNKSGNIPIVVNTCE